MNDIYLKISEEIEQKRQELEFKINSLIHEFEDCYNRHIYCQITPQYSPFVNEDGKEIILFPAFNIDKGYDQNRCSVRVYKHLVAIAKETT